MTWQELRVEDGEIGDPADINDISRLASAKLQDLVLGQLARLSELGIGNDPSQLFALGPGAYPVPSGSNRTIEFGLGTLVQASSTALDGATPKFLAYYVPGSGLSFIVAVGDATNPRIDLLCVQLTEGVTTPRTTDAKDSSGVDTTQSVHTRLSVSLASQVVAGTPAGSPAAPSCPSGWAVIASVYVPATFNTVVSLDNLRDHRIPLGSFQRPSQLGQDGVPGAGWVTTNYGDMVSSGGAPAELYYACPAPAPAIDRLLRVGLTAKLAAGATVTLVRRDLGSTSEPPTDTAVRDLSSLLTLPMDGYLTLDLPISSLNLAPVWGNGYPSGPAALNAGASGRDSQLFLHVTSNATTDRVRRVTWGLACG